MNSKHIGVVLGLLSLIGVFAAFSLVANMPPRVDEYVHFAQIQLYLAGKWSAITDNLTVLPGMHALTALIMKVSGSESLSAARLVALIYGAFAISAFFMLRRTVAGNASALSVLQLLWFPLLFPLIFFVYTDLLSLALVLVCVYSVLRARNGLAVLLLVAAMAVRQNNIVWGLLLVILALMPLVERHGRAWLRPAFAELWPYLFPPLLFVAYWRWHGSVSLSAVQAAFHPDVSFHTGNLFTLFGLAAILLPLHVLLGLREFLLLARTRPYFWAAPVGLMLLYFVSFRVDNPLNKIGVHFFLHNDLLSWVGASALHYISFGVCATAAACGLLTTRFHRPGIGWQLLLVTALYIGLSWLIEPRYYLIPFALWQAFRIPRDRITEIATLAIWICASGWLVAGIADNRFFL